MRNRFGALLFLLVALARPAATQEPRAGRLTGRVVDASTGLALPNAGVQVVGTTRGAMSDDDGRYVIVGVPAGTVTIQVRRIGYQPATITGMMLEAGATLEREIAMAPATVTLSAAVVTATAARGSVGRALDEQRSSSALVNATTAEQIARSPDANAAQAVQRVSGVTVQDGKYVFVRGLGERYTVTSLNGSRLPSPEPEKRTVPLDLFPAALIDAISTSKTFTPDQPGDFSGASVNIRTREFPTARTMSISTSLGWNSQATGRRMLQPATTGTEWLGFAGPSRRLPGPVAAAGRLGGVNPGAQTNVLLQSFRNAWSPRSAAGAPNSSLGLSFGGEDVLLGRRLGYVASTSYAHSQSVNAGEEYVIPKADGQGGATALSRYHGESGRTSVLWGGMLNLSTWLGERSRLSLDNSYNRSADHEARERTGVDEQFGTELRKTRLSLVERSVLASQLRGEHALGSRHTIDWRASRAEVGRDEPDRADLVYWKEGGRFTWKGGANDASRSFASLAERDLSGAANYRLAFGDERASYLKAGLYARRVRRTADLRSYDILNQRLDAEIRALDPETLFRSFAIGADTNLLLASSSFGGRYDAREDVTAGYAMVDLQVPRLPKLRVVAGARVERSDLAVRSFDPQGRDTVNGPVNTDVLPSLALSWALSETQALRVSATRTLSRPEYRELSPIAYADEGGDNVERGNPALRRALISNYDLRWELYPSADEVLSVSLFAKRFSDPIERVYQATTGFPTIGFTNAEGATNYGVELDVRKRLGALGAWADPFVLFANGTLMRSRIEVGDSLTAATNAERAMVGQAPYVVNAGLTWTDATGAASATLLYNVVGERITLAGVEPLPDTREQPRGMLDLSLQLPVRAGVTARLNARNLLDTPYVEKTGDLVRRRFTSGRTVSVGLGWTP